jgi:hypothetical protein
MTYNKATAEEARRAALHGSLKSHVERDVNQEIVQHAERETRAEAQRIDQVAGALRGKAIEEMVGLDREVTRARRLARLAQFIDYAFSVLYVLLGIRLTLTLMAANPAAGFVQFIRTVTDPFYGMFRGIVQSPTVEGGNTFALPIVIAIVAYMLLHLAIKGLFRVVAQRRTEI